MDWIPGIFRTKSLMYNYTSVEMYHEFCQFRVSIKVFTLDVYVYLEKLYVDIQV